MIERSAAFPKQPQTAPYRSSPFLLVEFGKCIRSVRQVYIVEADGSIS